MAPTDGGAEDLEVRVHVHVRKALKRRLVVVLSVAVRLILSTPVRRRAKDELLPPLDE